ncbi:hypothetical protein RB653_001733 [Dictyostelium firmibasis]|uniref:HPt domain-containing protein n=1 Tax=Dictyostelium firmibasis TaxID=79012 RepID=A0AAN7U5J6_9MYCE
MISDYEGPTPTERFDQGILFDYSEGEKEFTFELLESYISSVNEHLPELLKSFETKDIKAAVLHSHDIKGSSSYIGCEAVRYLSGKIEAYCKNEELEKAESFYPELKKEVDEVFKILSDFMNNWDKNNGGDGDSGGDDTDKNESSETNNGSDENNDSSTSNNNNNNNNNNNTENNKSTDECQNDRSKSPAPQQTTLKPAAIETPKTASDKIATETPTSLVNNINNNNINNNSKNENGLDSKQPQTSSNSQTKIQTK